MSIPNDEAKRKSRIGTKTSEGYKYSTKVDFSKDLNDQISLLMSEKKANDLLKSSIKGIGITISKFPEDRRKKNIVYYHLIGKKLSFLDDHIFESFGAYSIYRRIAEELPEILPGYQTKVIQKHLETMHKIGTIKDSIVKKGSWDQWYEILKFKDLYKDESLLQKVLGKITNSSGKNLREEIKALLKS